MKKITTLVLIISLTIACNSNDKSNLKAEDEELNELFALMQGSFNSEKQSVEDSTYYNISLHMYPIWPEKGKFLYVEQALNSAQDKPYRQRIYELKRENDSLFSSSVYTLKNEEKWIGKWKNPSLFDSISLDDISLKEGCEVILNRIDKYHFKGKTADTTCVSNLRGAAFASSQVEILRDKIISWDKGLDKNRKQVWGATEGGYVFDRLR